MAKTLDLKSTLNLPRTQFPMKANLPQTEPRQLAAWEAMGLHQRILEARKDAPAYILHDGPPYPTGEIHLGTALNKILKDMVVKSKSMAGFRAPFVPGWDCHGLPIETQVEKELGGRKAEVPPAEFRRMCRDFAWRYVEIHRREFKRLGVLGQWDDPYLTMSPAYESCIADIFVTVLERGYVYRGLKPVYWCIFDGTALAEAEVEYEDHTSPSIWVKFPLARPIRARRARTGSGGTRPPSSGPLRRGPFRITARSPFTRISTTWLPKAATARCFWPRKESATLKSRTRSELPREDFAG